MKTRTRLPVLIPARQTHQRRSVFSDAVCQMLAAVGIPADAIERERMKELAEGTDQQLPESGAEGFVS